jgi:hypothetical protein
MSVVQPIEMVDEEGFAAPAPAPCKTDVLLRFIAQGAIVECVNNVDGGREAKVVIEEQAPKGVVVLDGAIDY